MDMNKTNRIDRQIDVNRDNNLTNILLKGHNSQTLNLLSFPIS